MARRTLSDIKTAVAPWRRDFTDTEAEILCNLVLMDLDETFGRKVRRTFTTTAPDTTPTITINQGDTSATVASGSFPTTYNGQLIQIEGADSWYEISGTVADTSFNISSAFEGEDVVGGTCEVAFCRVVLPSDLIQIQTISRPGYEPLKLLEGEIPIEGSTNLATREPIAYYEADILNTNDYMEIILVDPPDDVYTYVIEGRARIDRFDGASSKCGLPERCENVLILGTLWAAISQRDGEEAASFWYAWYQRAIGNKRAGSGASYVGGSKSITTRDVLSWRNPSLVSDSY